MSVCIRPRARRTSGAGERSHPGRMRASPRWGARRQPSLKAAVCVAATVALVALAGCSTNAASANGGGSPHGESRYVSGDGSAVLIAAPDRQPAPDLTGTTLDGKSFDLKAMRGNVVSLNVWASWCAPCRAEAPGLDEVSRQLAPKGVRFVGLDTRDNDAAARAFTRRFDVTYPNVRDTDAQLQLQFRGTLPPEAIPSTLLIDRNGNVAGRIVGPADRGQLRGLLEQLAREPSAGGSG